MPGREKSQAAMARGRLFTVIPAKAGIHFALAPNAKWIPAFAGMTGLRGSRRDSDAFVMENQEFRSEAPAPSMHRASSPRRVAVPSLIHCDR